MTDQSRALETSHLAALVIEDVRREFKTLRGLAEKAASQVDDQAFFQQIDESANSIATLMKHVGGNLRSRWQDVLTTDGEKPDRRRDLEFVIEPEDTRGRILERWAEGWDTLDGALAALDGTDLVRTVLIRSEPHTIVRAINRALGHAAEHVGQIVFLAKYLRGDAWRTLSVPRGQSEQFNAAMRARFENQGS